MYKIYICSDPKCRNITGENVLHLAVQAEYEHSAQLVSHENSAQPAGQAATHNDSPDSAQPASIEDSLRVRVIRLLLEYDR